MKREFLSQQFEGIAGDLFTGIALNGNDTVNRDPEIAVKSGVINLDGLNPELTHRKVYAYLWARAATDAFAAFECKVNFVFNNDVVARLPLLYSYKNVAALGNAYRLSAFTWSSAATPILLPECIALKVESAYAQTGFGPPPASEPADLIYLHPRSFNFKISKIQVDVIRWTNISTASFRLVIATQAE